MSPEQARGKVVDKRADIWAFGCVLFEALTGRLAFPGETLSDTIATVLSREPAWERLPEATPPGIRVLLRRCLQKDPERRLRDAWDARLEIEESLSGASEVISAVAVTAKPEARWQRAIPWILVGLMVVVALWLYAQRPAVEAPQVVRTNINVELTDMPAVWPDISPDGTRIVYGLREGDERQLYSRDLNDDESRPIPGTEGGGYPFFSPDGEWVGFFADGQLKKVRLDGVGAVALSKAAPRGGSWGPDDTIVFKLAMSSGLVKIAVDGGTPEVLTTLDSDRQEQTHFWPQVLPNGKAVLFTASSGGSFNDASIVVQSLSTGERRVVAQGSNARYVSTGHLVYARGRTLYAVPFDSDRLEVEGEGVPVQVGVRQLTNQHIFAISETGTLVYQPRRPTERRVVLVDLEGRVEPLAAPADPYYQVRFSPDGQQLVLATEESKIQLYELEQERFSHLFSSFEDAEGTVWTPGTAVWSPDGTRLAVTAIAPGTGLSTEVFIVSVDGRFIEHLVPSRNQHVAVSWSLDGKQLLYGDHERADNRWYSWELPLEPKGDPRRLVMGGSRAASLSPDSRWLAYSSGDSGRQDVYVKPYGSPGGGRQVSIDGGTEPVWSPDV